MRSQQYHRIKSFCFSSICERTGLVTSRVSLFSPTKVFANGPTVWFRCAVGSLIINIMHGSLGSANSMGEMTKAFKRDRVVTVSWFFDSIRKKKRKTRKLGLKMDESCQTCVCYSKKRRNERQMKWMS